MAIVLFCRRWFDTLLALTSHSYVDVFLFSFRKNRKKREALAPAGRTLSTSSL